MKRGKMPTLHHPMYQKSIHFRLNGRPVSASAPATTTLLQLLRSHLEVFEVKNGCERGDCGACVVLMNGQLVNSCLVLAVQAEGTEIVTAQGLGSRGNLHPIQEAFVSHGAVQCGFCTPGMILAAKALLDSIAQPSEEDIRRAIAGNYCRCTGYRKIVDAIQEAARKLHSES